ncbi:MAG: PAS domain S-box protein [Candidatus Sulfotelmatobacter sp.]
MDNERSDNTATPQSPTHERRAHTVQFYSEDEVLLDEVSRFIGTALGAGDAAIVIATPAHREGLAQRLSQRGLDISRLASEGRFVALDAAETLSKITTYGFPDRSRFTELIGGQIVSAQKRMEREQPVAIFGEMVALLWAEGRSTAVLQLEGLWNEVAKTHSFCLRCAYPIGSFYREEHGEPFLKICGQHSVVIPGEHYTLLTGDEQRLRSIAYLQQRAEALEAEIALRHSEERFRLMVEAVRDYAIFMLDTEGRVTTWNVGAERIKGYRASEIIGRHFSCFYPDEDIRSNKPQLGLEEAAREGRFETEGWRLRKDGSKFWAVVIITAIRDAAGNLLGFGKVTRDFTDRMLADKALHESRSRLQESEKSLRELSLHLLRTQDEERRRIGRELHDSLGQTFSFMKMKLDSLKSLTGDGKIDEIRQDLAEFGRLVEDSVTEVRTISYLLYPPMLEELGLKSAISWYVDGFTKRSGIETTLEIPGDLGRLPRDAEMAVFRILQESLTNVHRHSASRTATVRLLLRDARLILKVSDQGKGIPSANLEESGEDWTGALGVGLRGMHERMRQLGGKLELESTSTGTTIVAEVPIETPTSADAASA